ncbi:two-component regulator propeller domain-containing protein [Flavobacterium sp. CFBP9031]|jgi:signal transduction histidine kinase/ligand-binding sensor domain-containing protein/DNA-binding response OmpR family regulator|uniref:hybrid sensor histidine kinase/response regulator transcription factor n=1 Tax=Flavobacterium sp. CFBP9031 TaxID=3096538 RepID=UPI002A6AE3F7|nr:two-component regulator propeller domain-containing protein [Flavobacterium sp. CFBP9031]MDY0989427.1 two-component regulator propeller domain-containing protein [Flavobacterium sp. CFBP9031]
MKKKTAITAFFCILLFAAKSYAQVQDRYFRNISVDKGLSQSSVFAIQQDSLGFIWIGTQDGLNRYDSKGFKVYRPLKNVKNSLQSYYIRSLFTDHKGQLWVGGNQGISVYNYNTDSFTNYPLPRSIGEWYISSITEDKEHRIWASSITGDVFVLLPQTSNFATIKFNASSHEIKKIADIGIWQQQIILGTDVGLFKLNTNTHQLTKIDLGAKKPYINDVYTDGKKLWVATEGDGLIQYNSQNGQIVSLLHNTATSSIADNNVRCVGKDTEGNIWLGTFKGLSIFNQKNNSFTNYYHQISQPYTISQNSVRCFFKDKQNGIWLGTYYGGLNYYHKNDIKFNLLSQNSGKPSLNDEVIGVIKQDAKGNFWIGSNDKGLNYWNKNANTITYFSNSENNPNSLSSNNIKAIEFDDNGNVLIGTHNGGLNLLNPNGGLVQRFLHNENDPGSIAGNLVYSILKDSKKRIWVGTRSGLDQFHPETKTFTHIHLDKAGKRPTSDDITFLFEDSKHRIWIGTTNGVTLFYPETFLFGNIGHGKLSDDIVNCITEDQKHRIWIGTREGLRLYDENQESFISFKTRKDFVKETIYGIIPDDDGNLWISTNNGLIKFNPDKDSVQAFDESDGLQNKQFNDYAFYKAKDGMLLFGGIKGISYFYPSMVKQKALPLKLSFTALEVLNKTVAVGDETGILEEHIDQTDEIEIGPEYKQFTIFFNTFNYISSNRTYYYYKLEGIDKDWQRTDELKVSYSNLPAGNYNFQIKAIGPNGEMSTVRSLKIGILPPWYKTIWFSLLLLAIVGTAAYIGFRIIRERIKAVQQLKLERIDKERVSYINQVKMDFFTNVSHELRTPLTLILAPLEELLKMPSADKVSKKKHELMFINAKRLYNLVDQLFEFRKTEMGTRQLKVGKGDIVSFTKEIFESFKPLSEKNGIQYSYHSAEPQLLFYFDKDAMEKILFNLLSNAFKYTKTGQSIHVELLKNNDTVQIKVADTGVGISEADLSKVFDRFYQVNNREMNLGSGVGLAFTKRLVELHHGEIMAESTVEEGSTFTVTIPISDQVYRNDQQVESSLYELSIISDNELDEDTALEEENEITERDQPIKLLIVDDNKEILDYLQEYFSKIYEVTTAYNGQMALDLLEIQPFDLIISDVMMPELDGLHFCKKVKQNINTSHIPLMLLTARNETSQQLKGIEMGADDYITKPFSTPLLAAKITNLLRSRKRLKEYYSVGKEMVPENIAFNTLDEEFLKQAIQIVEDHLADSEFSVDQFSKEIGMSRSNLYLKLKAITGESAMDFIKRIRFKKAVELMQSKRYTIAQITYMCGFNSPSYFSTAFKQHYGCMPSEYLASLDESKG